MKLFDCLKAAEAASKNPNLINEHIRQGVLLSLKKALRFHEGLKKTLESEVGRGDAEDNFADDRWLQREKAIVVAVKAAIKIYK